MLNLANKIFAYEAGELTYEEFIELFQQLVDSGLAWTLQGHYGRTAYGLIESGEIIPPYREDHHAASAV